MNEKPRILIVDDNPSNVDMLETMLDEYDIITAENGAEAVAILQKDSVNISLVLLDINMPVMDGYEVLEIMNEKHWIDDVPVIMISAENSSSSMHRAYELGITDFISRPFDMLIVNHRVHNTIMLYSKQKRLIKLVTEQISEKEKMSNVMINILSHIVEFRNGESGMHVLHVQLFTQLLLKQLVKITDKYKLTESDISIISRASALHDIGKISIPDEILNKPGRFTDEEFAIMKNHSMAGAEMLDDIAAYKDEPLVKAAYQICRWHHERYDGRGYPDGLKGDEIPIAAQIVAIADVYDALTSERVYKKAYSHEKAVDMILNNECGVFNPLLIECLKKSADMILKESKEQNVFSYDEQKEIENIAAEMLKYGELSSSEETLRLLEYERMKNNFFMDISDGVFFEYNTSPPIVTVNKKGSYLSGLKEIINNPIHDENFTSVVSEDDWNNLSQKLRSADGENPVVEYSCKVNFRDGTHNAVIICRPVHNAKSEFSGAVGKLIDKGI